MLRVTRQQIKNVPSSGWFCNMLREQAVKCQIQKVVSLLLSVKKISEIELEISSIELEISPNRRICRYLQLNCRYLQINWRYLQLNWIYRQLNWRYLQLNWDISKYCLLGDICN